jgi:hypothetical protein
VLFLLRVLISRSPARVIARERSDRSNLTVVRSVKYCGIVALPLVARNDETACIDVEPTGKTVAGQIETPPLEDPFGDDPAHRGIQSVPRPVVHASSRTPRRGGEGGTLQIRKASGRDPDPGRDRHPFVSRSSRRSQAIAPIAQRHDRRYHHADDGRQDSSSVDHLRAFIAACTPHRSPLFDHSLPLPDIELVK